MCNGPANCKSEECGPTTGMGLTIIGPAISPLRDPRVIHNPSIIRAKGERDGEDGAPPPRLLHLPSPFLSSTNGILSHPPL